MKDFSQHLVERLFNNQQINMLRQIFDYEINDFLNRLDSDPFADNDAISSLSSQIEIFMDEDLISGCQKNDVKFIAQNLYQYFL